MKPNVRAIVEQITLLRESGCTLPEAADRIGISRRQALSYTSTIMIERHCPDLLQRFRDSFSKNTRIEAQRQAAGDFAVCLIRGAAVQDVYQECVKESGVYEAQKIVSFAIKAAYEAGRGAYYDYVSAVLSGAIPEVRPPIPSLGVCAHEIKTHIKKGERPKECTRCGARAKLYRFWVGGSPKRNCDGVLHFLCRNCFCEDEVSPLEQIQTIAQHGSAAAQLVATKKRVWRKEPKKSKE